MFDTWSRLVVHVAMDNTVVIEEISECCCVFPVFIHISGIVYSISTAVIIKLLDGEKFKCGLE